MRIVVPACALIACVAGLASAAEPEPVDLSKIDRTIAREPKYVNKPHYALIVFGPKAAHRSWLVMDGDETLYFDRNGNGDLTEPDDRVPLDAAATDKIKMAAESAYSFRQHAIGKVAGAELRLEFWARRKEFVPKEEAMRDILRERDANDWETGTLWRSAADGSRAQTWLLLASRPADAQVSHLDGPLTFALRSGKKQSLRPWPKKSTFEVYMGTPALPPRNSSHETMSRLNVSEIPGKVHPIVRIEFPSRVPGGLPIVETIPLSQRHGDRVSATIAAPEESGAGMARVTLSYPDWTERAVQPISVDIPVGGEPSSHEPETAFVMFRDPEKKIGLNEAMTALRVAGFMVDKHAGEGQEVLLIKRSESEMIALILNRDGEVLETSRSLGKGTPHAKVLDRCESRLEIHAQPGTLFRSAETELREIQAALQKETDGVLFTWDGKLIGNQAR